MPNEPNQVTVFNFEILARGIESAQLAAFKATRGHILNIAAARVLEGTAERVPAAALDAEGRYRRIATGWGEL